MRRRARTGLDCGRVEGGAPAPRKKHPIGPGYFRRTKDSSQVVRIFDAVQDHQESRRSCLLENIVDFEGCSEAWDKAHRQAGTKLSDISFIETHDCFTIAELIEYEALGLAQRGEGARAIAEGWTAKDGKLPVNPSGGLKSKGHPIGATGVSMHVMASLQLAGEAQGMQVKAPVLAGIFNMGGAAVANYVSILERLR